MDGLVKLRRLVDLGWAVVDITSDEGLIFVTVADRDEERTVVLGADEAQAILDARAPLLAR